MGSRYRCRVSPSGVPGCTSDGGGTAGSDQGAGTLSFQGDAADFSPGEAGSYIQLSSGTWFGTDLENFTDLGFGRMRYDGDPTIALITARISLTADPESAVTVILTYGFDDASQENRVTSSVTTEGSGVAHVSISDTVQLDTGTILSLFATTIDGSTFTLGTGQLSAVRAG